MTGWRKVALLIVLGSVFWSAAIALLEHLLGHRPGFLVLLLLGYGAGRLGAWWRGRLAWADEFLSLEREHRGSP